MAESTDTRARILAAAEQLYLEDGIEALTMRSVAERLGVTATALYRHYRNKEELVQRLVERGLEVFGSYLRRSLSASTPWERLHRTGQEYLRFALEKPHHYELLFMSPARLALREEADCREPYRSATFQHLVDRVADCMRDGVLKDDDPQQVAVAVWAACHGLVSLWFVGRFGTDEDAFRAAYDAALRRLFEGLLARSPE